MKINGSFVVIAAFTCFVLSYIFYTQLAVETNVIRNPASLSVVTWNVWFDPIESRTRYEEILNIFMHLNPSVVCLQEVVPDFLDVLRSNTYFLNNYDFSDPNLDGSTIGQYGVLVLCKKRLQPKFSIVDLPSVFGRKLFVTEVNVNSDVLAVASVHLESLNTHDTREQQLTIINSVLSGYNWSILTGDFNFCSYSNFKGAPGPLENESLRRIMPTFIDMWPYLHPDQKGYTFDTIANPMKGIRKEQMRYDRVMFHLGANEMTSDKKSDMVPASVTAWRPRSIRMIGTSPIKRKKSTTPDRSSINDTLMVRLPGQDKKVPLYPSDHFGLYAEFIKQ